MREHAPPEASKRSLTVKLPFKSRAGNVLMASLAVALLLSALGCGDTPLKPEQTPGVPSGSLGIRPDESITTLEEALRRSGGIAGATYDTEREEVVFLFEEGNRGEAPIRLEDVAVALKSVRNNEEPSFSLDPAEPSNPTGPNLKARYSRLIEHTRFGQAMFEADWLLKEYSFGARRVGGKQKPMRSSVPGYKSIFDLTFARPWQGAASSYTRFWITTDRCGFKEYGDTILLDRLRMKVNTERMYQTAKGLESSGGRQDPSAERFAAHFSKHFNAFAKEQPALERVKQLAEAMALAKWLRSHDYPLSEDLIDKLAQPGFDTTDIVPAFAAKERRTRPITGGRQILELRLYGGVALGFRPSFEKDAALDTLDQAVKAYLATPDASPVFVADYEGKEYRGVVVPLTEGGEKAYAQAGSASLVRQTVPVRPREADWLMCDDL